MRKLAANIYCETRFSGVNVGAIITKEGVVMIDTPSNAADAQAWRDQLARLTDQPVVYIVNTDHHRDRVLGNQWFNAPVIAHAYTGERLRLFPDVIKGGGEPTAEQTAMREYAGSRIVPPQITFTDELTLSKGGRDIILRHMPGSTPGAAWVMLPEQGIVFTGDSVVVGTPPLLGDARLESWIERLAELQRAKFPATKAVVPGRGKVVDKKGVKPLQNALKLAERRMSALVKGNKPRSELVAVAKELMKKFDVPADQQDAIQRRLRIELDRLYDVMRGEVE